MAEDHPIVLTPNVSLGQANLGSLPLGLVGRIPLQSPTPLRLSPTTLPFDKQGALSDPYSHRCFTVQFSTCTLRAQTVLTQKKPGDYYGKSTHPVLRLLQYSVLHPRPLFFLHMDTAHLPLSQTPLSLTPTPLAPPAPISSSHRSVSAHHPNKYPRPQPLALGQSKHRRVFDAYREEGGGGFQVEDTTTEFAHLERVFPSSVSHGSPFSFYVCLFFFLVRAIRSKVL